MRKWLTIGAMAFAIVAVDASLARAQDDFVDENGDGVDDGSARVHRFGGRGGLRGVRSQLTDEQLAEVKTAIESLKESGATHDEVHAALATMLEGYGIELPAPGDRLVERLSSVLAADQLTELSAEIDALRESGASHEDIHAAIKAKLGEFGVDMSAIRDGRRGDRRGSGKFRGHRRGSHRPDPAPAEGAATDDAS